MCMRARQASYASARAAEHRPVNINVFNRRVCRHGERGGKNKGKRIESNLGRSREEATLKIFYD